MSSFIFNVTFDCVDPARLASFWAAVTDYEIVGFDTDDDIQLARALIDHANIDVGPGQRAEEVRRGPRRADLRRIH